MRQIFLLLITIVVLSTSCQRSQVVTTTRHNHNGHVTYTNSHSFHPGKPSTVKTVKNQPQKTEDRVTSGGSTSIPASDILKTEPIQSGNADRLTASAFPEPVAAPVTNEKRVLIQYRVTSRSAPRETTGSPASPDTIAGKKQAKPATGLARLPDTRQTEKLGLAGFILSIFGLIPVFGLPFAVIGVIFGAASLGKFRRNPELYKGKFFAIASLALGVIGIVAFFAEVAAFIIGMSQPM